MKMNIKHIKVCGAKKKKKFVVPLKAILRGNLEH